MKTDAPVILNLEVVSPGWQTATSTLALGSTRHLQALSSLPPAM